MDRLQWSNGQPACTCSCMRPNQSWHAYGRCNAIASRRREGVRVETPRGDDSEGGRQCGAAGPAGECGAAGPAGECGAAGPAGERSRCEHRRPMRRNPQAAPATQEIRFRYQTRPVTAGGTEDVVSSSHIVSKVCFLASSKAWFSSVDKTCTEPRERTASLA